MSADDFDMGAYERERDEFERREHNASLGAFEPIPNHEAMSDRGAGAEGIIDEIDAVDAPTVPEEARRVLGVIVEASRIHAQGPALLAARILNPSVRTVRELGALVGLGRSVTASAINALRGDAKFAGLFPVTGKVRGQQARRRREARQVEPCTKQCLGCGALFRAVKNQRYCKDCRPSEPAPARQRGAFYPSDDV